MAMLTVVIWLGLTWIRFAVRYRPVVLWQGSVPVPKDCKIVRQSPRYLCDDEVLLSVIDTGGVIEYVIAVKK